jgi:hypothetical protein
MSTLFFVLAFCIVALLTYMARYSAALRATQTRTIHAPIAQVYAHIANLDQWQAWNPWLEHERDAPTTLSGPPQAAGGTLSWDTPRAGTARIRHRRLKAPTLIEQRMDFTLPFRFKARARWQLQARGEQTEVTWSVRGRVGFAMRIVASTVQGAIALDLHHGLARLAALLEPASTHTYTLSYLGLREVPAMHIAHLPYHGPLSGLNAAVPQTVAQVRAQLSAAGLAADGAAVAVYLKTHLKQRSTECRIGIDLGTGPAGPLAVHDIPAHQAYVVRLQGPREAMEVAWYQAMQGLRIEHLQPDLRIAPFERSLAAPAPDQASTFELHLPLRCPAPGPNPRTCC